MSDTPTQGAHSKLAVDTATPFDASSVQIEFFPPLGIKMQQQHAHSEGIRGTRQRRKERTKIVSERISGPLNMRPSVTEIDWFLANAIGETSVGVTTIPERLPEFVMIREDEQQGGSTFKTYTWSGCRVARTVINGNQNQPISWTLEIEAETEATGSTSFATLLIPAIDTDTSFFIASEVTLTLGGSTRKVRQWTLTIDNMLDAERFNNSITRSEIAAQDLMVQLTATVPHTDDNDDLYDAAIAGAAGIIAITDGSVTYTFDFANCKIPAEGSEVPGKSEIMLPLTVDCYADGSNDAIKITKS